jgi:hypothetical protein
MHATCAEGCRRSRAFAAPVFALLFGGFSQVAATCSLTQVLAQEFCSLTCCLRGCCALNLAVNRSLLAVTQCNSGPALPAALDFPCERLYAGPVARLRSVTRLKCRGSREWFRHQELQQMDSVWDITSSTLRVWTDGLRAAAHLAARRVRTVVLRSCRQHCCRFPHWICGTPRRPRPL